MRLVLHVNRDTGLSTVLRRNVAGYDTRRVIVLADLGTTMEIKVPGHREATGYDRLAGGNTYDYVPVLRVVAPVIERELDERFGHHIITLDVPERS